MMLVVFPANVACRTLIRHAQQRLTNPRHDRHRLVSLKHKSDLMWDET